MDMSVAGLSGSCLVQVPVNAIMNFGPEADLHGLNARSKIPLVHRSCSLRLVAGRLAIVGSRPSRPSRRPDPLWACRVSVERHWRERPMLENGSFELVGDLDERRRWY